MAVPETTLWKREPHTAGKHLVLEYFPIDVIQRILANPKCEVYVTFMWEARSTCASRHLNSRVT